MLITHGCGEGRFTRGVCRPLILILKKTQSKTNQSNQKAVNRKQPKLTSPNNLKKQFQKGQAQNQGNKKANYQAPRKVKVPQFKKRRSNNKRNK